METTYNVIKHFILWVGQIITWMKATELVPGFTFLTVMFGATVIILGVHFVQQIFRSSEVGTGEKRQWRKHG